MPDQSAATTTDRGPVNRVGKLLLAVFILIGCLIFASALFGGLMDDRAFTPAAKEAAH